MERSTISRCEPGSDARPAMRRGLIFLALAWLICGKCFADSPPPLVPLPAEVVPGQGAFPVSGKTVIRVPANDAEAAQAARYLAEKVTRTRGMKLSVVTVDAAALGSSAPARAMPEIAFLREPGMPNEAYRLHV